MPQHVLEFEDAAAIPQEVDGEGLAELVYRRLLAPPLLAQRTIIFVLALKTKNLLTVMHIPKTT